MFTGMLCMLLIMAGILCLSFLALFGVSFFSNQCSKKVKKSRIPKGAAGVLSSLLSLISCVPWLMACAFLICIIAEALGFPFAESPVSSAYGFITGVPYGVVMAVGLFASFILHSAAQSLEDKAS